MNIRKIFCLSCALVFSLALFGEELEEVKSLEKITPDKIIESQWGINPLQLVEFSGDDKSLDYSMEFIIGENSQPFTAKRTLKPFAINKFETTYTLWYTVRKEAEKIGYNFKNSGQAGCIGKNGARPNEKNFAQPVTMINWYDAIVWCNAFSELSGKTPCYTFNGEVIKDSSETAVCDLCVCDWTADGYRLPSEAEWEYAAKKTKEGFQRGDLVSGQLSNDEDGLFYAWTFENADCSKVVGTSGTVFEENSMARMGTGNANASGIFDMSGNVLEYCWDWFKGTYIQDSNYGPDVGFERVSRGGSWSPYTMFVLAEDRYRYNPNVCYDYMGFRICCTVNK